ncbi:hypothetical protein PR048_010542 [Dryococelus australis]|uniref:Uncharacterized protein n=1 Tax=Dryococelus australis TaxID=614101 RepID=A0ABQ9I323_9NEOP|nr:hypothetical protein PR048_010542 [Dryococelus australis]
MQHYKYSIVSWRLGRNKGVGFSRKTNQDYAVFCRSASVTRAWRKILALQWLAIADEEEEEEEEEQSPAGYGKSRTAEEIPYAGQSAALTQGDRWRINEAVRGRPLFRLHAPRTRQRPTLGRYKCQSHTVNRYGRACPHLNFQQIHHLAPGSIPGWATPDFACGNRAGRCHWSGGFLGDLLFPPPFHSGSAPYSPQSPSPALKTSKLRAVQISSLTQ